MVDALSACPEVDPDRIVLVGRSFGGVLAPRGAAGERRLAAMIVDPGQFGIGAAVSRLGDLMDRVDDPTPDDQFESLLTIPAVRDLFAPRMVTHGVTSVREFCGDLLRYTNAETVTSITCPSLVTDNESDQVSTGQGRVLFEHLTGEKTFRLFTKAEGPRVTARGWPRPCSGPRPTTGWTTPCREPATS